MVVHDWYAATLGRVLESLQVEEFAEPEKVMFVTDHEPLATTPESSIRQKKVRELARKFRMANSTMLDAAVLDMCFRSSKA